MASEIREVAIRYKKIKSLTFSQKVYNIINNIRYGDDKE